MISDEGGGKGSPKKNLQPRSPGTCSPGKWIDQTTQVSRGSWPTTCTWGVPVTRMSNIKIISAH